MRPDDGGGVSNDRRQAALLRKRFGMEPKMVKAFEGVLRSDLGSLDRWEVVREERAFVWKLLRSAGAMEGVVAVAFTFFGLNRLPRYLARRATRKQQQQSNPYVLNKPGKVQAKSPFQSPNQKVIETQVRGSRRRFLFGAMELSFDIGMSVGVGCGVGFLASDEKEAEQVFVSVPLQPGHSLISDKVCHNLLEEYQRQWDKGADNREILREPHHHALQIIKGLAQNCRHRHVMENQLREDGGLLAMTPLPIPESGVIPLSEDPLLIMMQGSREEDLVTDSSKEVTALVQDQEEQ